MLARCGFSNRTSIDVLSGIILDMKSSIVIVSAFEKDFGFTKLSCEISANTSGIGDGRNLYSRLLEVISVSFAKRRSKDPNNPRSLKVCFACSTIFDVTKAVGRL